MSVVKVFKPSKPETSGPRVKQCQSSVSIAPNIPRRAAILGLSRRAMATCDNHKLRLQYPMIKSRTMPLRTQRRRAISNRSAERLALVRGAATPVTRNEALPSRKRRYPQQTSRNGFTDRKNRLAQCRRPKDACALRIIDRTLHLSRAADEEYKNNVRTYCTASLNVAE